MPMAALNARRATLQEMFHARVRRLRKFAIEGHESKYNYALLPLQKGGGQLNFSPA